MLQAVEQHFSEATMGIFAAAVADYRPVQSLSQKLKKTGGEIVLHLEQNPDILATAARKKGNRQVVGFAAETENVAENARKKLKDKNADLIVANDVTAEGAGFDVDTNVVTLFARDGRDLPLPKLTKREVAQRILDEVVRLSASVKHQSAD
jgi:phosphopantothenoylcysteine decarboxylase/phosphopantothenate--cysteine ligase